MPQLSPLLAYLLTLALFPCALAQEGYHYLHSELHFLKKTMTNVQLKLPIQEKERSLAHRAFDFGENTKLAVPRSDDSDQISTSLAAPHRPPATSEKKVQKMKILYLRGR